jgi:hypothetical protein
MYAVYIGSDTVDIGLIAPWWSRSPIRFEVSGENEAPPTAAVETFARRTLRAKYAAHVPNYNVCFLSDPDPMTGNVVLGNTVWWGIGHDLVFLLTSAFAAANVACVPRHLRRRRTGRRLQRCECPSAATCWPACRRVPPRAPSAAGRSRRGVRERPRDGRVVTVAPTRCRDALCLDAFF